MSEVNKVREEVNVPSCDQPVMDMHLIDELLAEIQEQMKMKFSDNQLKKLHCLSLNAILHLKSEYFYSEDTTSEQEEHTLREIRVCYKSIGNTPSASPEDYLPIVNIITCGKISNMFKKHNHKFIIIQDGSSKVMCRLDNILDLQPTNTENDIPEQDVSEHTRILLNAIEKQKNELEKKTTEIHLLNEVVDLLNHNVQVKGKLTFINNNKQLVILVNSCFIIDEVELAAFHNLLNIREKYDKN